MSVFRFLLLIGVCGVVCLANIKLPKHASYNLNEAEIIFNHYMEQYDKVYKKGEYEIRLEIFKDNLRKVNEHNAKNTEYVVGLNQFSDMTFEEFADIYLMKNAPKFYDNIVKYTPIGNAPAELDYRQSGFVTGIKNQGECGSCYAFAAIGNIEGIYAKQSNQLISLSEQQGMDCDTSGSGCKGGNPENVMTGLANQGGSMREEDYPYEAVEGTCRTDSSKIVVRVTGGSKFAVNSEEELKDSLANTGPLSIGLIVCTEFQRYTGGVYSTDCPGEYANHALLLVGYGSESGKDYWIIKNSWDTTWGEQGYMRMIRGRGLCGIGKDIASATIA